MPTIKTKKEMNLPQLIEWATSNDITNTFAKLKSQWPLKQGIRIHNDGRLRLIEMEYLSKNNIFTVEIEEPVTEDTVIPEIIGILRSKYSNSKVSMMHNDKSVNEIIKGNNSNGLDYETLTLHVINDDDTLTLIWTKEKGLVE